MELTALYRRVGQKLGVLATTEEFSAEDVALVADAYVGLWSLLESEQLATWDVDDVVPDNVSLALVDVLAAHLVDEFALPDPRRSQIRMEGLWGATPATIGERRLRRSLAGEYIPEPVQMDYF